MERVKELILYKDTPDGLLARACALQEQPDAAMYAGFVRSLAELSMERGFAGNLWHCALTYILVYDENPWSKACEIRGAVSGGINALAQHDLTIFREFFGWDFAQTEEATGLHLMATLSSFENETNRRHLFNSRIRGRIVTLAQRLAQAPDTESFKAEMETFYREFGCGKFGLHKAFRVVHEAGADRASIVPITNTAHVQLEDLVGYEIPKRKLIENTEAFVSGRHANNCLLFGDAGTGKSSAIKGILNRYYDRGLRIIEVYRHQFRDLVDIIDQIKNRNYRFLIYMDDLSFEESETDYKYLKALIEGGLERRPDNVLIYATSNRRHLIRENYSDKGEDVREDMHTGDTVQEKLSLAYRFGVTIYFGAPDKKQFEEILRELAARGGITMPEEQLFLEANKWELSHGGRTGRTAQQFIDYLLGRPKDEENE